MNNVNLIGRLTRDPELTYTANNNTARCVFTIAVDRPGKDSDADFIRITAWGKQAEICDRYLSKGRQVAVIGRIQTGTYTDKEGKTIHSMDVIANSVEFLGAGGGAKNGSVAKTDAPAPKAVEDDFESLEADIPF